MSTAETSRAVDGMELERLLDEPDMPALLGSRVVSAQPLSRFRAITAPRSAWRVELADGRCVKVRRLKVGDTGDRLAALLATTDANDFARIVAWRGRLVVEEWIEGVALGAGHVDDDVIRRAGALLGRLHAVSSGATTSTDRDRAAMDADLEQLFEMRTIDRALRDRLAATIALHDPGITMRGIVHGDFCGENLVSRADGRLCSIDNEDMAAGSVDGDLIRSLQRWGLAPAQHDVFLRGYADIRDPAAALGASPFWVIRSRAHSARVRSAAGDSETAQVHVRVLTDMAGTHPSNDA